MGGGGQKGTTTVVQQPSPPQIAEEFKPYAGLVGSQAEQMITSLPLLNFLQAHPLAVPGLSPLQQQAVDLAQQRVQGGIPQPTGEWALQNIALPQAFAVSQIPVGLQEPESAALMGAAALPFIGGQQVNVDPLRYQAYGNVQGLQQASANPIGFQFPELSALGIYGGIPGLGAVGTQGNALVPASTALEQQGAETLGQFAGGELGNSPAIQAAVEQIARTVIPTVENKMTLAGLGHSGALGTELASAMTGALVPLYQQGLQQQQSAGGQLAQLGGSELGRAIQAQLAGAQGQQQLGGAQAQRLGEAIQRPMQLAPLAAQTATAAAQAGESLQGEALQRFIQAVEQASLPTALGVGGQMAARETSGLERQLGTLQNMYQPLLSLGGAEAAREQERITEGLQTGALVRDIAGQMAQAEMADFMRRQALSEVFGEAFLGAIPSFTTFPMTETATSRQSGGK